MTTIFTQSMTLNCEINGFSRTFRAAPWLVSQASEWGSTDDLDRIASIIANSIFIGRDDGESEDLIENLTYTMS